jgi:hypothetical protein
MQQFKAKSLLFLGEQDGVGERELKSKLCECFITAREVELAYLARVSFEETPGAQVALCLKGVAKNPSELIECLEKVFKQLFKTTQHLEIFFLSDEQVTQVGRVAKPFYSKPS